jgi:hypothetical protein
MFFFEKKNQKIFPGASRAKRNFAPTRRFAFQRRNACGPGGFAQRLRCVRSTRGKFFGSFFQKRTFFPYLCRFPL